MKTQNFLIRPLAVVALFAVCGVSHAAISVFDTRLSFLAATTSEGVDTFTGFSTTAFTQSPTTRTAGTVNLYSYTATAGTGNFIGAGPVANPALSTQLSTSITFDNFTGGAMAIGGLFYDTNAVGSTVMGGITLVATDALGATFTQVLTALDAPTFFGFVSDSTITSLIMTAKQPANLNLQRFATVDNLRFAKGNLPAVSPVPEPETYALMFGGLCSIAFMTRRRCG